MTDDRQLLREYAVRDSQEAFATLVSRHIDLVYSTALRHVGNHHQAEEITQAVFIILARKARSLSPATIVPGWLFRTTRLTAANLVRAEARRARREQEAFMEAVPSENPSDEWQQVAPLLNDAIATLRDKDRDAIVLRFLQGKAYKEVAASLGGSEEAAQMRVNRALEKLRGVFAKRGVVLSGAALGGLIAAHGTQAAPVGLAASVAATAAQGAVVTGSTLALVKGTLKVMAWTKLKLATGAGVVVLLAYQHHQNSMQAQQLATVREDLRVKAEAAAAQEARIGELEQQSAAILETRHEQAQELARLRARRAAKGGAPQAGATASTTLLSAALQETEAREALRRGLVNGLAFRWEPLVKELKLGREEAQKLYQVGGDWLMKNLETVAAFTDGRTTAEAALQAAARAEHEATNQVRVLVGAEGMAIYQECEASLASRSLVRQLEKQLGFYGMNEEQRARLAELIRAEPYEHTRLMVGLFEVRDAVIPGAMTRLFEQTTEANQRMLLKAAEFLGPEQVEALGHMQNYNLSNERRLVLRMLRKL